MSVPRDTIGLESWMWFCVTHVQMGGTYARLKEITTGGVDGVEVTFVLWYFGVPKHPEAGQNSTKSVIVSLLLCSPNLVQKIRTEITTKRTTPHSYVDWWWAEPQTDFRLGLAQVVKKAVSWGIPWKAICSKKYASATGQMSIAEVHSSKTDKFADAAWSAVALRWRKHVAHIDWSRDTLHTNTPLQRNDYQKHSMMSFFSKRAGALTRNSCESPAMIPQRFVQALFPGRAGGPFSYRTLRIVLQEFLIRAPNIYIWKRIRPWRLRWTGGLQYVWASCFARLDKTNNKPRWSGHSLDRMANTNFWHFCKQLLLKTLFICTPQFGPNKRAFKKQRSKQNRTTQNKNRNNVGLRRGSGRKNKWKKTKRSKKRKHGKGRTGNSIFWAGVVLDKTD